MNTPDAKQLIKDATETLLEHIESGTHPNYDQYDLAEGMQLEVADVYEWIYDNHYDKLCEVVPESETQHFDELIEDVLNGDWYEELYHRTAQQSVRGVREVEPSWKPKSITLQRQWKI